MVWRNLTKYKCPECFAQLERPGDIGLHKCTICTFKISALKLDKFVTSMLKSKPRRPELEDEENIGRLNNL